MKLKIEVKLWKTIPRPHLHTYTSGGGGLLDSTCTQGQLLMRAKLFSGTTKCQKYIVFKNKPVWIT